MYCNSTYTPHQQILSVVAKERNKSLHTTYNDKIYTVMIIVIISIIIMIIDIIVIIVHT